jgi:nucleotide-binding universal stress UspA family protein
MSMARIEHIVVPVDEWSLAENLVEFARRVAAEFSARVSLLHVIEDIMTMNDSYRRQILAEHHHYREEIRSKTGMDVQIRTGAPVTEIIKFAFIEQASLIAMSTHGRDGVSRVAGGSVTEEVLRQSPVPLLMSNEPERVLAGHSLAQLKRILMPVHTRAAAEPILPMLTDLAVRFNAEVVLYHDERGVNDVGESLEPPEAARALEECASQLTGQGVRVAKLRATGAPVATDIVNHVKSMDVDLVVMTTHGRTGLMRGFFGSVTEAVLRHSPCPVLAARYQPEA